MEFYVRYLLERPSVLVKIVKHVVHSRQNPEEKLPSKATSSQDSTLFPASLLRRRTQCADLKTLKLKRADF